jgi:hypothetical protein
MRRVEWSRLSGEDVETVLAMLLQNAFPAVTHIKPSQGDGGIDIRVDHGAAGAEKTDVYQIKSFTGPLTPGRKNQIQKSLDTFVIYSSDKRMNVSSWHLVMPENPTNEHLEWFKEITKNVKFTCEWHGLNYVDNLAAKYPHVITAYLGREDEQNSGEAADASRIDAARQAYRQYLTSVYGFSTLNGLPHLNDTRRRFRLEDVYVPQHVVKLPDAGQRSEATSPHESINAVLGRYSRISVVGSPGSGKSTLIKYLAANFTDRFPVVVRCRDLLADRVISIQEILEESFSNAQRPDLKGSFSYLIKGQLSSGLLLLIDGLDEIRDAPFLEKFISSLLAFLDQHAKVTVVLTSREASFRNIKEEFFDTFAHYRITPFAEPQIKKFITLWYQQMDRSPDRPRANAKEVTREVLSQDRVRAIAVNPLLLTVIMLVRQFFGSIPLKRTALYQQAIEVLLKTWNEAVREEIDLHAVEVQLAFISYKMMVDKKTRATENELSNYLKEARRDLSATLGQHLAPVEKFLEQIEERSSLLTLNGRVWQQGRIVRVYEFQNLTFQEYLAAVAITRKWLPTPHQQSSICDIITSVIGESQWMETVTMAALLSGHEAPEIVKAIIKRVRSLSDISSSRSVPCSILIKCLREEIEITPTLARKAFIKAVRGDGGSGFHDDAVYACSKTRFFPIVRKVTVKKVQETAARDDGYDFVPFQWSEAIASLVEIEADSYQNFADFLAGLNERLISPSYEERLIGTYMLHCAGYESETGADHATGTSYADESFLEDEEEFDDDFDYYGYEEDGAFARLRPASLHELSGPVDHVARDFVERPDDEALKCMQAWALAWSGPALSYGTQDATRLRTALFETWFVYGSGCSLGRLCGWAIGRLPLVGTCQSERTPSEIREFLDREWQQSDSRSRHTGLRCAVVVAGFCLQAWPIESLGSMAAELCDEISQKSDRYTRLEFQLTQRLASSLQQTDMDSIRDLSDLAGQPPA